MRRALATLAAFLAFAVPAYAVDLPGTVVFEKKPGCEGLPTNLLIRVNGDVAEVQYGPRSRGNIKINPETGAFLEKQTVHNLIIGGTIHRGALVSGRGKVEGGCIGRFMTKGG